MTKRIESDLLPLNKHDLLGFLDEMPPDSDDANFDISQQKYWQDLFARFSYFLGCFDGDQEIFQKLDRHYLDTINATVLLYFSLYKLLFCAWENDIIPLATQYHQDFSKTHPLNFLKAIMLSDWELEEAKNRMKVKPTLRESYNLLLKISPTELLKIEKSKHPKNRRDKLLANLWGVLPDDFVQIKYIELFCESALHNSKSPVVKKYLAKYQKDLIDYMDIIMKIVKSSLPPIKNSQTSTKLF